MLQPLRKFEKTVIIKPNRFSIKTPQGWKPITKVFKTIPYDVWYIKLENGDDLKGADTHILYTKNHTSIYLQDITVGMPIETDDGYFKCIEIKKLDVPAENMYDVEVDSDEHEFYSNGFVSHNTTTSAIYLLWFAMFNKDKTIAVLANKADTAKGILAEIKYAYEYLPLHIKSGVVEYNAFNVKFENGCTIFAKATSADALRGESVSCLFCDEYSHVPQNIAEEFWTANYPTISTGGSCIVVSTPNGTANEFYKLWKDSIDGTNNFHHVEVKWSEVPERDEKWKERTIRDLGSVIKFNQEFGCQFVGSSVTLIDANFIIKKLKWEEPVLKPDDYSKLWKQPQPGHKYLVSIDTSGGVGSDFSVMNVFDITFYPHKPAEQVAIWARNDVTPPMFTDFIHDTLSYWNNAYLIGETNGLSNEVLTRLFDEKEYENIYFDYEDDAYGICSDKVSKPQACVWFKEELEQERLIIRDSQTIDQLGYFEEVSPGVYKAKGGRNNHDDCVITCIWAAHFLKSRFFEDVRDTWNINKPKKAPQVKLEPPELQLGVTYDAPLEEEAISDPDVEAAYDAFLERDEDLHGDNWLELDEKRQALKKKNKDKDF